MNLEELQTVRDTERSKDSLQALDDTFYGEVGEYLADLREERDRVAAQVSDPFGDPAIRRLSDEIKTAERTVEALYERRVGKLVKLASFTAAGIPTEEEGLTVEEQALFDAVVEQIESNRQRVLDVLVDPGSDGGSGTQPKVRGAADEKSTPVDDAPAASGSIANEAASDRDPGADSSRGDGPTIDGSSTDETTATDPTVTDPTVTDPTVTDPTVTDPTADEAKRAGMEATETATGRSNERPAESASNDAVVADRSGPERTTVRITRDVGEIVGIDDRSYELSTDDVVTLPTENAKPLLLRDAAEPLE